jgi:hypothetical protein
MSDNLPPLPETTWMLWCHSAYEDPYCSYSEGYTEGDMLAYATAAVDAAVAAERERWADEIENRRVEIRQRAIDYLALDTEARALQDEVERLRAALARQEQTKPAAWIDGSGHPRHISYVQSATERRLYGPLRPLYERQLSIAWPAMPPRKGQSPVLFEDGYDEGWAKCLEACKAAVESALLGDGDAV